ncbi:MAG: hypothetical protein AB3X46_02010 [Leptothrix ochracea]|uniref:hypothetical protein n=1 Tax=Leptothrix ochracea TaxID=735331 RepID=UPI0034E225D7
MKSRFQPLMQALALSIVLAATSITATAATTPASISYTLGPKAMVQRLYPDASWLPADYAGNYPDLAATIEKFTLQSLARDGVTDAKVTVSFPKSKGQIQVRVKIEPTSALGRTVARRYAKVHPQLLDATHAQAALSAVTACQAAQTSPAAPACWDPQPVAHQPWALYLPLGLPMAAQRSVLFLDYPPIPALTGQDYLNNFTMCRWERIMGAAGATNPHAFEAIVDSRPIAAPGSGAEKLLPNPQTWFNSPTGAVYLTPTLQLLSSPPHASSKQTLPVAVFGSAPRATWAQIVGQKTVKVMDVGTTPLGGQARQTPWIATNHPDVTSYNCCPGDPAASCAGSHDLLADEQLDFVAACWLQTMSAPGAPTAEVAKQRCQTTWQDSASSQPSAQAKQTLCVQAKLDNQNRSAQCASFEEAWNYCSAHDANACATFDCTFDATQVKQPVPALDLRPTGWQDTCHHKF